MTTLARREVAIARLLLLLGIGLRLWEYLRNRSLWLDESSLALNILDRSPRQLFAPLEFAQGAPIGFLLLEKLSVTLFGVSEYALRLWPLLAGIGSLLLFVRLARQTLARPIALPAIGLFSILTPLVYYSAETKQYGFDVLFYLLIVLAALRVQRTGFARQPLLLLFLVGTTALAFSHASIFVLACVGLGLLLAAPEPKIRRRLFILGAAWCVIFLADYWFLLRPLTHHPELMRYWRKGFWPLPPQDAFQALWPYNALVDFFESTAGFKRAGVLALALATLGGIALVRLKQWPALIVLLGPALLVLAASSLHKYPFNGRLILFLVSPALLLIGWGLQLIWTSSPKEMRPVAIVLALLLIAEPGIAAFRMLKTPLMLQSMRPALQRLLAQAQPDDLLLIGSTAANPYRYYRQYSPALQWKNAPRVEIVDPSWTAPDVSRYPRVWAVFSHYYPSDMARILDRLDRRCRCVKLEQIGETRVYLYETGATDSSGISSPFRNDGRERDPAEAPDNAP